MAFKFSTSQNDTEQFSERVAQLSAELSDDRRDWYNNKHARLLDELLDCIKEQQAALRDLHAASWDMRHGGYRSGLVAKYDGWARETRAVLEKWKLS